MWFFFFSCTVFENHRKSLISTLRAKRARLTFWVDKSSSKMPKTANLVSFWKPEACGQTVLPDRSLLIGQKLVEMLKFKNRNATFWVIFKHCDKDEINTFLPKDATFHLVIRWSLKTTKSFPMFFESIHCDWKSTKKSHSKLKIWTFCQIMLTFLSSAYFLPNYAWICLFIISWFLPNYSHICFSISLIFPNYAHISFI